MSGRELVELGERVSSWTNCLRVFLPPASWRRCGVAGRTGRPGGRGRPDRRGRRTPRRAGRRPGSGRAAGLSTRCQPDRKRLARLILDSFRNPPRGDSGVLAGGRLRRPVLSQRHYPIGGGSNRSVKKRQAGSLNGCGVEECDRSRAAAGPFRARQSRSQSVAARSAPSAGSASPRNLAASWSSVSGFLSWPGGNATSLDQHPAVVERDARPGSGCPTGSPASARGLRRPSSGRRGRARPGR